MRMRQTVRKGRAFRTSADVPQARPYIGSRLFTQSGGPIWKPTERKNERSCGTEPSLRPEPVVV